MSIYIYQTEIWISNVNGFFAPPNLDYFLLLENLDQVVPEKSRFDWVFLNVGLPYLTLVKVLVSKVEEMFSGH